MVSASSIYAPIVILIFDNNGQIEYRAYSPVSYNPEDTSSNTKSIQFHNFLDRVHSAISFDELHNGNNTPFGKLLERHYRFLPDLELRKDICYFTTYTNPHCHYKPIDVLSPIHFNEDNAVEYASIHSSMFHRYCTHHFV